MGFKSIVANTFAILKSGESCHGVDTGTEARGLTIKQGSRVQRNARIRRM